MKHMQQRVIGGVLLGVILLASGCYRHEFTRPNTRAQATAAYSSWHHHFLWGLVNASGAIDLDSVCPNGVATIENEVSFVNGLLQLFTGYLYQPTTVTIHCSDSARAAQVTIRPDAAMVARLRAHFPNLEQDLRSALQAFEAAEELDGAGSRHARANAVRDAF